MSDTRWSPPEPEMPQARLKSTPAGGLSPSGQFQFYSAADCTPEFDVDVNEVIRLARARIEKMYQTEEALKTIRVKHTSEDQACSVEVDGYGKLLALSLTHGIDGKSGAEVGGLIVQTCADAARKALARFNEIIDEFNETILDDANFPPER